MTSSFTADAMLTSFVDRKTVGEQDADRLQLRLRLKREPRASELNQNLEIICLQFSNIKPFNERN